MQGHQPVGYDGVILKQAPGRSWCACWSGAAAASAIGSSASETPNCCIRHSCVPRLLYPADHADASPQAPLLPQLQPPQQVLAFPCRASPREIWSVLQRGLPPACKHIDACLQQVLAFPCRSCPGEIAQHRSLYCHPLASALMPACSRCLHFLEEPVLERVASAAA